MLNIPAPEDMLHEYRGVLGLMEAEKMLLEAARKEEASRKKAEAARLDAEPEPRALNMNCGTINEEEMRRMFGIHR